MLRHGIAIMALPFTVAVIVPAIILARSGNLQPSWTLARPMNMIAVIVGALLLGSGIWLFFKTVSLFATVGEGTLAPWDPPRKFVVRGIYRYVRNPMISGVLAILLGESVLLASLALFYWFVVFFLMNAVYIPLSEERGLLERFGEDYTEYKKNVPRWIPRTTPWEQK